MGKKDRKHKPVLGQRKEQHLLFKIYRELARFHLEIFPKLTKSVCGNKHWIHILNGNINVNDTHKACFLIGSVIHIQNIDLTISQSMTDCRRSTFTHHILPHKWTKPLPSQEGPSALCSANHLQVEPSVRLTPAAGSTSMCTRWQLTWRCHCGSDISPEWSQHSPRSQSTTSMIYSVSNRMYLKKEKWRTDGTQTVKNFPVVSCVHQGHACGTYFQVA